jgi:hypothetical protein
VSTYNNSHHAKALISLKKKHEYNSGLLYFREIKIETIKINIFLKKKKQKKKKQQKKPTDLPLQGPIIINVQTSYLPGERVSLNCTSAPSKPMAILQWSIDGEQVSCITYTH